MMTEPRAVSKRGLRAKKRVWVTPLVLCIALVAFLGTNTTLWVSWEARSLRDRIEELEKERQQWVDQHAERPPVRGSGLPGNAWDDYRGACARLDGRRLVVGPGYWAKPTPKPRAEVVAFADAIRAGALRSMARAKTPEDYRSIQAPDMARTALWCARFDIQEGRPLQAVDRCMDAAWFGTDVMRMGRSSWSIWGPPIVNWSLDCATSALLAAPALAGKKMLPDLRRLIDSLPRPDGALMDMGIRQTQWVLDRDDFSTFGEKGWSFRKWMHFRQRQPIYILDMAGRLDGFEELREASDTTWPRIQRTLERIHSRSTYSSCLNIYWPWDGERREFSSYYRTLARLHLLQAAASNGAVIGPDPFGGSRAKLHCRREAGRLVFWSIGPDGVDDSGRAPADAMGFVWKVDGKRAPDVIFVLPSPD